MVNSVFSVSSVSGAVKKFFLLNRRDAEYAEGRKRVTLGFSVGLQIFFLNRKGRKEREERRRDKRELGR